MATQIPQVVAPTIPKPTPVVAPSMATAVAPLNQQLTKAFTDAQNFGRMNPEVVQQALSNGGSLSSSLGFNSPLQVAGLSPQELLALTNGHGVNSSLQQAGQNFDMITGGKESRDSQRQLAQLLFNGGMTAATTDVGNQARAQEVNATNALHADTSNATNAVHAASTNATNATHVTTNASTISAQMKMAHDKLALERQKFTYLKNAASQNGAAVPAGTEQNPAMVSQYNTQLKQYGAVDKNGVDFNLGSVPDNLKQQAYQSYMQREAAKGLGYGTIYDVPQTAQPYLQNYSKLVLGADGWHGVFPQSQKDGTIRNAVTPVPVVPYRSVPSKASQSASGYTGMPVYPGATEE